MSNIEHKDVGVSSLKGTPSKKIYIKTSTEAVHNPEGVTQEYINNHVDGSKIVNGTITNSKIVDNAVTMGKLDNEVQTLIQQGADSSWTPMGDYDVDALYYANDLVFDPETNSSYLSLRADNMGHAVTDASWWMKVIDGSYEKEAAEIIEAAVAEVQELTEESVETIQSLVDNLPVAQVTGQSTTSVMSQKAVTDEIMTPPQSWDLSYGGDFTWELGTIHDDGKAYSSSSYYHLYIPVSDIKGWKVKLKAQPTNIATYTLLKNIGFAYPSPPLNISSYYCEGYSTIVTIPAGQEATFVIPNDCNYLYISCGQISGDVRVPQSNSYCTNKWGDVVQITGDSTHAVMSQKAVTDSLVGSVISYDNSLSKLDAENVQGALDEIQGFNTLIENLDKATLATGSLRITSTLLWYNASDSHYFIPCVPGDMLRLTGSASVNYAFVTRYDAQNNSTIYPSSIYSGEAPVLLPDEIVIVETPSDAVGLVINRTVSGVDKSPSLIEKIEFVKPSELKEEIDEIKESDLNVYTDLPITSIGVYPYRLTTAKNWAASTDKHYWIPCQAGDTFKITAGSFNFNYAFLHSHNNTGAISADVSSIYVGMDCPVLYQNDSIIITCPSDAIGLAVNSIVNGNNTDVRKIERITSLKDEISSLNNEVSIKTQILGDIRDAKSIGANGINADTGGFVTSQTSGHTDYLPTNGAKYIMLYTPDFTSSVNGIAFYNRIEFASYITGTTYNFGSSTGEHTWRLFEVPEGANFFRATTYINVDTYYRLVVTTEYLMDIFKDSAAHCLATHIFRSAKMVSEMEYKYAFPVQQVVIIDGKAYITYFGSETTCDDDVIGRPNSVLCRAVVNLCDMSYTTEHPTVGSTQYADGTTANPVKIGYVTECPTPNNSIAKFGLMRFNNKNPYYCWAIEAADVTVNNWKTCKLNYQANGTTHNVDFTINAYRQMLVDMGYTQTYIASTSDIVDNVNIHYDKTEGIYYAVLCGTQSSSQILPIVLMESADLSTWSPVAYLGINTDADEIGAIYKDGIVYVAYRTYAHGMNYVVYDVEHNTLISSGKFPTSNDMLSKPDVFTFDNNVYMAININPSVYGDLDNYRYYHTDARQEIAIYKVVEGVPKFFRRVNNPTGLNYYSFMETPPMYAEESSVNPMYAQGAIYVAFSEDRRHLYRRQIAQVSFADVTALFADNGRIG